MILLMKYKQINYENLKEINLNMWRGAKFFIDVNL